MPERDLHQQRVKKLLAQDPEINDKQMEEFRMQFAQNLELSEAKAKQTRRRILITLAVYLSAMVICLIFVSQWREAAPNPTAGLVRGLVYLPFLVSYITAGIVGIWLVAMYVFKYAPRLNQARFELQTSMLLELQQQVKQLQENVGRQEK
jgi:hypothetical protein